MKAFDELVEAIENKMFEVGTDNIDYSAEKYNRFCYYCGAYIESKKNMIYFEFKVFDCGTGFYVNNIKFENNEYLPNIIEKLNKTTFKYEN